ncbi:MAG: glycosyltransferase family 2 protein, partial [Phycisphaerales bacterium]|nr:glycosyltransferase family 2 protein [Phycisphaerales bacterium]
MPPRSSEPVDVSVVVATRNRAELLPGHLESLVRQELPPDLGYEVILVDDGSEDETPEVLARACADRPDLLRWMSVPHAGMGLARNAGARAARGRLLLFTDDDVIVPPSWVAGLVDLHARHGTAALSGGFDPLSTSARPE